MMTASSIFEIKLASGYSERRARNLQAACAGPVSAPDFPIIEQTITEAQKIFTFPTFVIDDEFCNFRYTVDFGDLPSEIASDGSCTYFEFKPYVEDRACTLK